MTEKELLELGYFPKELPPPFESKCFASQINTINLQWNRTYNSLSKKNRGFYSCSKWTSYSIPKVQLSRRILNIPNPLHQSKLVKTITDRWQEIEVIFKNSTISSSYPIKDKSNERAFKTFQSFRDFKRKRLNESFDKYYEMKTDVSRFYSTIYTHSIPWLIHTKALAKANRNDMTMLGNALDRDSRNLNSGQTVGIPIGPDTSLIIAEIITCSMDKIIQSQLKNAKSFRFIDDYFIYCDNYAEAEESFRFVQKLFNEYQLDINEEKTKISNVPFSFEKKWSIELGSFTFRTTVKTQLIDIERFVSLSMIYAEQNPKDSVLLFSMQVLKNLKLFDENWNTYEALILRIGMTEPRTLPVLTKILASNLKRLSKTKVKSIIYKIIETHLPKGHNHEVSWALWMCVEFKIKLNKNIAEQVFASNDYISMLIAMDLKSRNLIHSSVDTSGLLIELTEDSLMNENWLFTYESIKKGWLQPINNPIDNNKYFKILLDNGIYFYREDARVEQFKVVSMNQILDKSITQPEPTNAKTILRAYNSGGDTY